MADTETNTTQAPKPAQPEVNYVTYRQAVVGLPFAAAFVLTAGTILAGWTVAPAQKQAAAASAEVHELAKTEAEDVSDLRKELHESHEKIQAAVHDDVGSVRGDVKDLKDMLLRGQIITATGHKR